eukprot:g11038.t2
MSRCSRTDAGSCIPRMVPWRDWDEWYRVKALLFSPEPYLRSQGVQHVAVWQSREHIPHAVETTSQLVEARLNDVGAAGGGLAMHGARRSDEELRLIYSAVVVRAVNCLTGHEQKSTHAAPVSALAREIGLPTWIVDIRHEAAHKQLPGIVTLRLASDFLVDYLWRTYWGPQAEHLGFVWGAFDQLISRYKVTSESDASPGNAGQRRRRGTSPAATTSKKRRTDPPSSSGSEQSTGGGVADESSSSKHGDTAPPGGSSSSSNNSATVAMEVAAKEIALSATPTALSWALVSLLADGGVGAGSGAEGFLGARIRGQGHLLPRSRDKYPTPVYLSCRPGSGLSASAHVHALAAVVAQGTPGVDAQEIGRRITTRWATLLDMFHVRWRGFGAALLVRLVEALLNNAASPSLSSLPPASNGAAFPIDAGTSSGDGGGGGGGGGRLERQAAFIEIWVRHLLSRRWHLRGGDERIRSSLREAAAEDGLSPAFCDEEEESWEEDESIWADKLAPLAVLHAAFFPVRELLERCRHLLEALPVAATPSVRHPPPEAVSAAAGVRALDDDGTNIPFGANTRSPLADRASVNTANWARTGLGAVCRALAEALPEEDATLAYYDAVADAAAANAGRGSVRAGADAVKDKSASSATGGVGSVASGVPLGSCRDASSPDPASTSNDGGGGEDEQGIVSGGDGGDIGGGGDGAEGVKSAESRVVDAAASAVAASSTMMDLDDLERLLGAEESSPPFSVAPCEGSGGSLSAKADAPPAQVGAVWGSGLGGVARTEVVEFSRVPAADGDGGAWEIDGPARQAWTLPYIVSVNDDVPFGLSVAYPRYFPGEEDGDRLKWYATTVAKDIILTAEELYTNQEAALSDFDDEGFSAVITFSSSMESAATGVETVPGSMKAWLVRGMAYTTVEYDNYTPEISSIHAILSVNGNGVGTQNHTSSDGRFVLDLNDGTTWILYSSDTNLELYHVPADIDRPSVLKAVARTYGTLRVTRVPYDEGDAKYDEAVALFDQYAGSYPICGELTSWMHRTDMNRGRYRIDWTTAGDGAGLLHYALPHHQLTLIETALAEQNLVRANNAARTGIYLASPTKGDMELFVGTRWIVAHNDLPDFEWVPGMSGITDPLQLEWINFYLEAEIPRSLDDGSVAGGSIYFGGKHLMAYAQLCLVAEELGRTDLLAPCLDQVEEKFDLYLRHENGNALVYDEVWGGVIGEQGLEEDNGGADFFSAFYNDHHFHYSYLINVAAVLAHLQSGWLDDTKEEWVNTLLRDVNSPDKSDPYFPQFRSFDWFSGHSWARGLLFAYDGKDQESTSEDVNFYYAMTMWGIATDNLFLTGLGRLQTRVVANSVNEYFLMKDSNTNHPADFVKNKVTGIFFESKVDYTTWFGANVEYIHGIQNIPVTAITVHVRDPQFCREEWEQRLASVVEAAEGNWDTVLYMSYATIQKNAAFKEMLTSGVDVGLYRAWALYWAATRPECSTYCSHDEVGLNQPPVPTPAPTTPPPTTAPVDPTEVDEPFMGVAAQIPGTVEAEEYDYGGPGVAYSDTDPGNNGGAFRTTEQVDISAMTGGYNVGWLRVDEWMKYTVDVTEDVTSIAFSFSVASPYTDTGKFRLVTGGTGCDDFTTDLTGEVVVPLSEGWSTFIDYDVGGQGSLSAGETEIWFCVVAPGFNIDSWTINHAPANE